MDNQEQDSPVKEWARSRQEQEDFLRDETTDRVRQVLRALRRRQRRAVVDQVRFKDLPGLRYEAGVEEGLRRAMDLITEAGDDLGEE